MYYKENLEDLFEKFKSSRDGLCSEQVEGIRKTMGYNELVEEDKKSIFHLFMDSFKDPLVIILILAAGIQVVSGH
ncbi:MAG: cation-transporting P-type ATPase, partial [Fusobacteriaceae bacterium]